MEECMSEEKKQSAGTDDGMRLWFIRGCCIGCGACVEAAPGLVILNEKAGVAEVVRQPEGEAEVRRMRLGASICPVQAIGVGSGALSV